MNIIVVRRTLVRLEYVQTSEEEEEVTWLHIYLLVLSLLGLQSFAPLLQDLLLLSQALCPPAQLRLFVTELRLKAQELLLRIHGLGIIQGLWNKQQKKCFGGFQCTDIALHV